MTTNRPQPDAPPLCRDCGEPLVQQKPGDRWPKLRLRGLHFAWGEWRGHCVSCGALNRQPPALDNDAAPVLR